MKCSCGEELGDEGFPDDESSTAPGPLVLCFLCWTIKYPLVLAPKKPKLTLILGGKK